jgi:hypothetical protein
LATSIWTTLKCWPGSVILVTSWLFVPPTLPGLRDDDGQPVINPRSANVEIVCACDYRGSSCGKHLGGVWRTSDGIVLVYKVVRPDARAFIQKYKGRRRGPMPPRTGDRYPDRLLANEEVVLLTDARDISVSCFRLGSWTLDLFAVRQRLEEERLTRKHLRYGSKPPS